MISIIPAPQKSETTEQDNTKNTSTENNKQVSQEPTGKDTEEPTTLDTSVNDNNNIADQLVDKHVTKAQDNNNKEDQLVEKAKHKIQKSNTSSTISQEYCNCTPPLSPVREISDINTADLEALNETL